LPAADVSASVAKKPRPIIENSPFCARLLQKCRWTRSFPRRFRRFGKNPFAIGRPDGKDQATMAGWTIVTRVFAAGGKG
jgi:hypothetical protein